MQQLLSFDYHSFFKADGIVDVAIIGGGFTGPSTALHGAEKGLNCHVLEAEQIGWWLWAQLWTCECRSMALSATHSGKLGSTYGPRFIDRFGKGPEYVFSLIERHQIQWKSLVREQYTVHIHPRGLKS